MTKQNARRHLLATCTNDPFQPVRLYYTIPNRGLVAKKLRGLKCIVEGSAGRGWEWLFHGEAASLQFAAGYDAVPEDKQPIVLGRIRFPSSGGMILETNASARAIAAAKFFAPRLGSGVVLRRCRVVNRYFSADEGMPAALMKIVSIMIVIGSIDTAPPSSVLPLVPASMLYDPSALFSKDTPCALLVCLSVCFLPPSMPKRLSAGVPSATPFTASRFKRRPAAAM